MNKIVAVAAIIAVVALGGFWLLQNQSPTGHVVATQPETVKIAYVPAPFNAMWIVALRKGFFEQEGLKVEETRASFVGYVFPQLVTGDVDVLSGAETPGTFVALKGGAYKILATDERNTNDLVLVSRADANVSSIRDLVGKKVGMSLTSVAQYNLWRMLEKEGIDPKSVNFTEVPPQNMGAALSKGDVDAIFTWEPVPSKIIAGLGDKVASLTPESAWFMNIYVSKQFAGRKNTQEKLFRALLKAQVFLKEHPAEAISIVAKETNLDEKTLSTLWNQGKWTFKLEEFKDASMMQQEAQWAIDAGLVQPTAIPNFTEFADSEVVRKLLKEG